MTDALSEHVDQLLTALREAVDDRPPQARVDELLGGADEQASRIRAAWAAGPDQADAIDSLVTAATLLDELGRTNTAVDLLTTARDGQRGDVAANALAALAARHGNWADVTQALAGRTDDASAVNMALAAVYGSVDDAVQDHLGAQLADAPARDGVQRFALRSAAFEQAMAGNQVDEARAALVELEGCAKRVVEELGDDDPYLDFVLLIVSSARCAQFAADSTADAGAVDQLRESADALGVAVQRMSLALGPTHVHTLGGLANLAYAQLALALADDVDADVAARAADLARTREQTVAALGDAHRLSTRLAMNAAGAALEVARRSGSIADMAAATDDLRQAAQLAVRDFGVLHPITAIAVANVAAAESRLSEIRRARAADDLLAAVEASLHRFNDGDVVEGVVLRVDSDEVVLDIGEGTEAVLPAGELALRTVDPNEVAKPGETIEVVVVRQADDAGRLVVSRKRALAQRAWVAVEAAQSNNEAVRGKVVEVVKGGLIMDIGLRAFLPASLVDSRRVRDLRPYLGRELDAMIIEIDKKRNNVVLSRRAWLESTRSQRKTAILDQLTKGQVRSGVVSSIVDFGAFVDLGGIDGLVHLSELSWQHVDHPSEVVEVGQRVLVEVREVDPSRERVSLSMKAAQEDPWRQFARAHAIGQYVRGTVTKIRQFGAFLRVADGIEGLVHISELTDYRVGKPEDVVHNNEELIVRVVDIDLERRRVSLSLRQANAVPSGADFDPTEYGMAAEYDANGQFVFPEGFDQETNDWLPGYETQRDEWERQYQDAESAYQLHMRQLATLRGEQVEEMVWDTGTADEAAGEVADEAADEE